MSFHRTLLATLALVLCGAGTAHASNWTLRYPDGSPRWTYSTARGVPNGASVMYYPSGSVMVRGAYRAGLKHGLFTYFDEDGSEAEKAIYVNGVREWRSGDDASAKQSAQEKLAASKAPSQANTGTLRAAPLPFLPFSSLDRYSRRFGISLGGVSAGEERFRRIGGFANFVFGRYGIYLGAAQSFVQGEVNGGFGTNNDRDKTWYDEQAHIHAAGTYHLATTYDTHILLRGGYLQSFDPAPEDTQEIVGLSGGLRAADQVGTFQRVKAYRASASVIRGWKRFIGQADVGLDLYRFYEDPDNQVSGSAFRLNLGVGYILSPHWQFMLENTNTFASVGNSMHSTGLSVNYLTNQLFWFTGTVSRDHNEDVAMLFSVGSFLLRFD